MEISPLFVINHVTDEHTNFNLLYIVETTLAEVMLCVDIWRIIFLK